MKKIIISALTFMCVTSSFAQTNQVVKGSAGYGMLIHTKSRRT